MNKIKFIIAFILICVCSTNCTINFNEDDSSTPSDVANRLRRLFTEDQLRAALVYGEESLERMKRLEETIELKMKVDRNNTISYSQLLDGLSTTKAQSYDNLAQKFIKATSHLLHALCKPAFINDKHCVQYLSTISLPSSPVVDECLDIQRQLEDHTNNLHVYRRLLKSEYKDAIYKMRESNLPSPRQIAEVCYSSNIIEGPTDSSRSVALAQWTQFIEHDLSKTAVRTMGNGAAIECCSSSHATPAPRYRHPSCETLKISDTDSFYRSKSVTCLNYVRSAIFTEDCHLGAAEQLNQATNNFDLSQLYGDSFDRKLRSFVNGELKTNNDLQNPSLPLTNDFCINNETECFYSGDSRVNLNPYITMVYTIFLRSHNRLTMKLHKLNPHWDDDKLFTFAKKINTAIYQKIIYEEWAPVVLGSQLSNEINGARRSPRQRKGENRVSNEFATAAIKFYNTMMPGDLYIPYKNVTNSAENVVDSYERVGANRGKLFSLEDTYFNKRAYNSHSKETILTAILQQKAMAIDINYVDDLSNKLYRIPNTDFGTDSLALDIQRGRDHGFPGYVRYLEKCQGDTRISDWNDLAEFINDSDLQQFKKVYASVHDIDLIIGLISEKSTDDATVGPTLMCILGDQLLSSRKTDHYFYTRPAQKKLMKTIATYSAAQLLCDVTSIATVQENIFLIPSTTNPMRRCDEELGINLSLWKEL